MTYIVYKVSQTVCLCEDVGNLLKVGSFTIVVWVIVLPVMLFRYQFTPSDQKNGNICTMQGNEIQYSCNNYYLT